MTNSFIEYTQKHVMASKKAQAGFSVGEYQNKTIGDILQASKTGESLVTYYEKIALQERQQSPQKVGSGEHVGVYGQIDGDKPIDESAVPDSVQPMTRY